MANLPALENKVRERRDGRGWSQEELARHAGLSRAGISAIETGRLVPSTAAALALAEALCCRVEDLFHLPRTPPGKAAWAWSPRSAPCRFWHALVTGQTRYYPVEASPLGLLPHDGIYRNDAFEERGRSDPANTLVLACCDPAGGLLAAELARSSGVRLIILPRSSAAALALLQQGLVHAAGVHLSRADAPGGNAAIVRGRLGPGFSLLHVAHWEEGIAFAASQPIGSIRDAVRSGPPLDRPGGRLRCPGMSRRTPGARRPPRRLASDHRGVAEAVRCGWADAGVCLRVASEEAGLEFLSVRREAYDVCFPDALKGDPRLQALIDTVRSPSYRRLLGELPGYDSTAAGKLQRVS